MKRIFKWWIFPAVLLALASVAGTAVILADDDDPGYRLRQETGWGCPPSSSAAKSGKPKSGCQQKKKEHYYFYGTGLAYKSPGKSLDLMMKECQPRALEDGKKIGGPWSLFGLGGANVVPGLPESEACVAKLEKILKPGISGSGILTCVWDVDDDPNGRLCRCLGYVQWKGGESDFESKRESYDAVLA